MCIDQTRLATGLILILAVLSAPAGAQSFAKDDAYWQAYVGLLPPNSSVDVRLKDGELIRGRVVIATTDGVLIRLKRFPFLGRVERSIQFGTVADISRKTHLLRNVLILGAVGETIVLIFLANAGSN